MDNKDEKIKTPRRGPGGFGGPGMRGGVPGEKAKNFKSAISRLVRELDRYKVLIVVSLVLAMIGAILSILAPNKLSKLTDEISSGLVVNKDNLEILTNDIKDELSEENLKGKLFYQLIYLKRVSDK